MGKQAKRLLALMLSAIVLVTGLAVGLTASATGDNLLDGYTVSSADVGIAPITNGFIFTDGGSGTIHTIGSVVLKKNNSYELSFNMKLNNSATNNIFMLGVRGSAASTVTDQQAFVAIGTYGNFYLSKNETVSDGHLKDGLYANVPYTVKIQTEPKRARLLINGSVVALAGADGDGWVTLPAVEDGRITLRGYGGTACNVTLTNFDLRLTNEGSAEDDTVATPENTMDAIDAIGTVDAYSREAIEKAERMYASLDASDRALVTNYAVLTAARAAFDSLNLVKNYTVSHADTGIKTVEGGFTFSDGYTSYVHTIGDVKLARNAAYVLEFDMMLNKSLTNNIFALGVRGQETNVGNQQMFVAVGTYTNAYLSSNPSFSEGYCVGGLVADRKYRIKIESEPKRARMWLDGVLAPLAGADSDGWVPLPAVDNGRLTIVGYGGSACSATITDISLTAAGNTDTGIQDTIDAIDAIGTVDAYSRTKIREAQTLYDALTAEQKPAVTNYATLTAAQNAFDEMNLLKGKTVDTVEGITRSGSDIVINVNDASKTAFFSGVSLNEKATYIYEFDAEFPTFNNNYVGMILRNGGQYLHYTLAWNRQLRLHTDFDFNNFIGIWNPFPFKENEPIAIRVIIAPDKAQVWANGNLMSPDAGGDKNKYVPLKSVADGKIGFMTAEGMTAQGTFRNLSLTVADTANVRAAEAVDALIDAIGTVSLTSGAAIEAAEAAYGDLTADQLVYLLKADTLTAARTEYDRLVAESTASEEDHKAAEAVDALIDAIGDAGAVSLSSLAKIEAAENAYNALSEKRKALVTKYNDLLDDRAAYNDCIAANEVDAKIAAIGTVGETSGDKITAARTAYDALTDAQKKKVTALPTLISAEKTFAALKSSQCVRLYFPTTSIVGGANYWPDNLMISDIEGGGIRYVWQDAGTDWRTGITKPVSMDGLHMVFNNVTFSGTGRKMLAMYLADANGEQYSNSGTKCLMMILDAESGSLKFTSDATAHEAAGTPVITDPSLKAENLSGKTLDLKFTANGDGSYTVTLNGSLTGTVTKAMMDAAVGLSDPHNAYITLCPWSWSPNVRVSLELLALHGGDDLCTEDMNKDDLAAVLAVIDKINAIDPVITLGSEPKITEARAAYDALRTDLRGLVANDVTLTSAEYDLAELKAGGQGMTFKDPDYYRPDTSLIMGTNYWPANVFNTDNENGIHFRWENAGTDWRRGINKALQLDGMHLVFDNLRFESANKRFVIYICDLRTGAADWGALYSSIGNQPLMVVFDCNNGLVKICTEISGDSEGYTVIRNPALLAKNMEGKPFDLLIKANNDGSYTMSVKGIEGTIPAGLIEGLEGVTQTDELYVTLCPWDWAASTIMEYDLVAIHSGNEICADEATDEDILSVQNTIALIRAIYNDKGQIDADSVAAIGKARSSYNALSVYIRGIVENYDDLLIAEELIDLVEGINGIGTVTLEKADAIRTLDAMYRGLDASKRPLVGNYLTLRDALLSAYKLQKAAAGYEDTKQTEDVSGDKPSSQTDDRETSPQTGDGTLALIISVMILLAAGGVTVLVYRRRTGRAQ